MSEIENYIDVVLGGDPELLESGGFTYYDDLDDTEFYSYEVYESNGGSLTLFVIDDFGNPVYGHGGYEYFQGDLCHDIEVLEGGTNIKDWDGNCEAWTDYGGYVVPKSLEEWYEEVSKSNTLIVDDDGIYFDKMGVAGEIEFKGFVRRFWE